ILEFTLGFPESFKEIGILQTVSANRPKSTRAVSGQQNDVIIRRILIQAVDNSRTPVENSALIDVALIRDFAGIDGRRFFQENCTRGIRGAATSFISQRRHS